MPVWSQTCKGLINFFFFLSLLNKCEFSQLYPFPLIPKTFSKPVVKFFVVFYFEMKRVISTLMGYMVLQVISRYCLDKKRNVWYFILFFTPKPPRCSPRFVENKSLFGHIKVWLYQTDICNWRTWKSQVFVRRLLLLHHTFLFHVYILYSMEMILCEVKLLII